MKMFVENEHSLGTFALYYKVRAVRWRRSRSMMVERSRHEHESASRSTTMSLSHPAFSPRPVASTGGTVFMCETSDRHTGYTA